MTHSVTRSVFVGVAVAVIGVLSLFALPASAGVFGPRPAWLPRAEQRSLRADFHASAPLRRYYIYYPKKIAVVWVFGKPVWCYSCRGLPGGSRLVRVAFLRKTHTRTGTIDFCHSMKFCLRR